MITTGGKNSGPVLFHGTLSFSKNSESFPQFGHAHGAGHLLIDKKPETASRANIRAIRIIKPPPIRFTILTLSALEKRRELKL